MGATMKIPTSGLIGFALGGVAIGVLNATYKGLDLVSFALGIIGLVLGILAYHESAEVRKQLGELAKKAAAQEAHTVNVQALLLGQASGGRVTMPAGRVLPPLPAPPTR
jgi:hypothetical protein